MTFNSTTAPSIGAFLAQPADDLEDQLDSIGPVEAALAGREDTDPLTSIAGSLQAIADAVRAGLEQPNTAAEPVSTEEMLPKYVYDDLAAKYDVMLNLIADVEAALGKSTAKPSLAAKAVIEAWRNPSVPAEEDKPEGDVVYTCPHCGTGWGEVVNLCTECGRTAEGERVIHRAAPAHDAPVEEWRAFARHEGHGRTGPAFNDLEQMNRSQIRTLLGIEQPVSA